MKLKSQFAPSVCVDVLFLAFASAPVLGQTWVPTGAPCTYWSSVACSADGTRLLAASEPYGGGTGAVYMSSNAGVTWEITGLPTEYWSSVSCSADAKTAIVTAGDVYVSTNSGSTWAPATGAYGWAAALSADGTKQVVVDLGAVVSGAIYVSTNSGTNWRQVDSPAANGPWLSAAASADGSTFLAAGSAGYHGVWGYVAVSTNSGASWWAADVPNTIGWACAAVSADGIKLVVAGDRAEQWGSWVYVSSDRGVSWKPSAAPMTRWTSIACSADGANLAGFGGDGFGSIYSSSDAGATWAAVDALATNWSSVASSADGAKVVASAGAGSGNTGLIYAYQRTPAPVLSVRTLGAEQLLSWTVPSRNFILQQSPTLVPGEWKSVGVAPVLNYTNLQYQVSIPKPDGTMFFRLASQ